MGDEADGWVTGGGLKLQERGSVAEASFGRL
jgi:hypothetical protein